MTTTKKKLEKDIMREICEEMEKMTLFFWRSNNIPVFGRNNAGVMTFRSLPRFTPRGLPDILWINNGILVALEVKRDNTFKLRPEQADFAMKCIKNNAYYFIVYSVGDFLEIYEKVKKQIDPYENFENIQAETNTLD